MRELLQFLRCRDAARCFALAAFLFGLASASPPVRGSEAHPSRFAGAMRPPCPHGPISFASAPHRPVGLLLSPAPNVRFVRLDALLISRPELFRFRRFEGSTMSAVLSDGCAVAFRSSWTAGRNEVEEIQILDSEAVERNYRELVLPQRPQPAWIPAFEGYRHVMSRALSPLGASHIGLWHRTSGTTGSLVAMYERDRWRVTKLGEAAWTYDGVYPGWESHTVGFVLVDEPEGAHPLYMTTYAWELPNACCRDRRQ